MRLIGGKNDEIGKPDIKVTRTEKIDLGTKIGEVSITKTVVNREVNKYVINVGLEYLPQVLVLTPADYADLKRVMEAVDKDDAAQKQKENNKAN